MFMQITFLAPDRSKLFYIEVAVKEEIEIALKLLI